jgi:hypothetical protein
LLKGIMTEETVVSGPRVPVVARTAFSVVLLPTRRALLE